MKKKGLGLWALTALVTGNMIASGIFLLPANLARIGTITIFSWIFSILGAMSLAFIFSKMSLLVPKAGGPYAYAKKGFGDFVGFQTAYSYWIAVVIGNAAMIVALMGYLQVFWPSLSDPLIATLFGIAIVWLFTLFNLIGVRFVGGVQILTTVLKLIPLILIAILGWWYIHPHLYFEGFNVSHTSNLAAVSHGMTISLWAFIGVEAATVVSGTVDNPEKNIPRATVLGTLIAAVIYFLCSVTIMGMVPANVLATSPYPFAVAAKIIFGVWGKWIFAAAVIVSILGALNGWILLQGQIGLAAAEDGMFPKFFAKKNSAGIPGWGIVLASILITVMIVLTRNKNMVAQFQVVLLMATFGTVIPYLYTTAAAVLSVKKDNAILKTRFDLCVCVVGLLFSLWALFGSGEHTIYYGSLMLLISVPLYAWMTHRKK